MSTCTQQPDAESQSSSPVPSQQSQMVRQQLVPAPVSAATDNFEVENMAVNAVQQRILVELENGANNPEEDKRLLEVGNKYETIAISGNRLVVEYFKSLQIH